MKTRFILAMFLAVACMQLTTESAQAGHGLHGGYGYGAYDVGRLYRVLAENVPHYAAFPPVYYSVPVPRTYGYSPFAYPPGVKTPEIVDDAKPVEIINPHFQPTSTSEPEDKTDQVTETSNSVQPLVVVNPYITNRLASVQADR